MSEKYLPWLASLLLISHLHSAHAAPDPATLGDLLKQPSTELAATCQPLPLRLDEALHQTLRGFYQAAGEQPQWTPARLQALHTELAALADDGLEPREYALDLLREAPAQTARSCQELLTSSAYLRALQHLAQGRLDPQQSEPLWHAPSVTVPKRALPDPAHALAGLEDLPATFTQARPAAPQYQALRAAYAAVRQQPLAQWEPLEQGPLLRPGRHDPRVPALAQRLQAGGYLAERDPLEEETLYSSALVEALKAFQRAHHVQDDGVLGPATLRELNVSPLQRRDQLRVNLERWRWLARELEPDLLLVDIAGAQLQLYREGRLLWQARSQVGRAERPTPPLKSRLSHLTLNPTWTVPPTIFTKDKLPQIRNDPGYLTRNHMQVLDYAGNRLDPQQIDWSRPGPILLRQTAGSHNPLGRVAIRFANPFSVYLHDTPSQALFDKLPRVFSSGCVRVERAAQLTDLLLDSSSAAQRQRIAQWQDSGETRNVNLPRALPILMAYWTASVEDDALHFRPDLYHADERLRVALDRAIHQGLR
nr:L,D-transpeptidase family protein [Pseudomonas sp. NW5]